MPTYEDLPFDATSISDPELAALLPDGADYVELPPNEGQLRELVLAAVAKDAACKSFLVKQTEKRDDDDDDDEESSLDDCGCPAGERTAVLAGLGLFKVGDLWVLHQTVGEPCGTDCGVALYRSLVVFASKAAGGLARVRKFCDDLIEASEVADPRRYAIYRWHLRHQYWRHESRELARPLESIVLPATTKSRVVGDLAEFLSSDTRKFYTQHGVPYRRSYLFYGVPGAGKSSLIAGLAGKFQRNVCYLQLCDKEMSDDALKTAIHRVPSRSIVVLEDIDAMFQKNRQKKNDTPLTFSGLLNALDGIGSNSGQIFVLTTNERENLDEALIRHGRVDVQVEFRYCVAEQASLMFENFYPAADAGLAGAFAKKLFEVLGDRPLSTAALQGFFIHRRRATAREALDGVEDIATELDQRDTRKAMEEAEQKKEQAKKGDDDDDEAEEKKAPAPAATRVGELVELVKLLQA